MVDKISSYFFPLFQPASQTPVRMGPAVEMLVQGTPAPAPPAGLEQTVIRVSLKILFSEQSAFQTCFYFSFFKVFFLFVLPSFIYLSPFLPFFLPSIYDLSFFLPSILLQCTSNILSFHPEPSLLSSNLSIMCFTFFYNP